MAAHGRGMMIDEEWCQMKLVEPGLDALNTARTLLLEPWGLDESHLARALSDIHSHRVDYADLYFQYSCSEGWSLEEGIVKTGSFSIDQGVGVRAVSGEKTAFAYSDSLSPEALMSSARAVRTIARQGAGRRRVDVDGHHRGAWRLGQVFVEGVVEDGMVGVGHHLRQEQHRIADQRLRLALEGLGDVLHRDLRSHFAMQMPAHAVGDDHQQGVARVTVGDAVLVGRALADAAFLVNSEFHVRPMKVLSRSPHRRTRRAGITFSRARAGPVPSVKRRRSGGGRGGRD